MDIISTWIYLDRVGEESKYPQVRGLSSSEAFQRTYWRCVVVFFEASLRYHREKKHMLFTNAENIPVVDGFDVGGYLRENEVEIVRVENDYQVPPGYYGSWNNQFFEFSIVKFLADHMDPEDTLLLLDSDCIFNRNVDHLFQSLREAKTEAYTYRMDYAESYSINGISRQEMQTLFADLGLTLPEPPHYSGGEVLFAKAGFIRKISADFAELWRELMRRFEAGELKLNEEAHVLSYFYYKYPSAIGKLNAHIKRCWTNPFSYRNIEKRDRNLDILHLPAEKDVGIKTLFNQLRKGKGLIDMHEEQYGRVIDQLLAPRKHFGATFRKSVRRIFSAYFF